MSRTSKFMEAAEDAAEWVSLGGVLNVPLLIRFVEQCRLLLIESSETIAMLQYERDEARAIVVQLSPDYEDYVTALSEVYPGPPFRPSPPAPPPEP